MHVSKKIFSFLALHKKLCVSAGILLCIALLSNCMSNARETDIRGEKYAGSQTCRNCHQQVYDSFVTTAHANTSSNSLPPTVIADFAQGKNAFKFNDSVQVLMEKKGGKYYQTYLRSGKTKLSHPFDIVVGSGRKAQTYLYYNDKQQLFQLPVSYFMAEHAWANSPGFPAGYAMFNRNVPSYCMGCHSSYIGVKQTFTGPVMDETFEKNKIVYGIDCERCHGPSAAHVDFYTNRPADTLHKFITKISTLNRTQKTDMCALCHSGFTDVQQSLFKFKPGDKFSDYWFPEFGRQDTASLDVHGNQTQLMMASACFKQSNALTCTSCHNPHVKERDDLEIFSNRCSSCHNNVQHSFAGKNAALDNAVTKNCIDCHMPQMASGIKMLTNQKTGAVPDFIRTHLITIYEKESKRFADSFITGKRAINVSR